MPGYSPPDHSQICKTNPETVTYYAPTGYRRIPLTTCQGGRELEFQESRAHPCAGHEKEFDERHAGLGGFGLFLLAVVLPFGLASAVGWWVYNHWDGKFGRIRLGGDPATGGARFDTGASPWVQYPVMAVAVVVAAAAALPDVLGRLWRFAARRFGGGSRGGYAGVGRYTTRGSFARGQGDYDAVVAGDEDEGELLGEDSDEEV